MEVMKVATVVGQRAAGAVAAGASLAVGAPPATASAKATAAAAAAATATAAAAAAAAIAQPKVQKYNKTFWPHLKYNKNLRTNLKYKRPHQKHFFFADPPKMQWTHQIYNNNKKYIYNGPYHISLKFSNGNSFRPSMTHEV
jgi:opacity protein-like surface antigen